MVDTTGALPSGALRALSRAGHHTRDTMEVEQICLFWPETEVALAEVIGERTTGFVFLTKHKYPWFKESGGCPASDEFRKVARSVNVNVYQLPRGHPGGRRTFRAFLFQHGHLSRSPRPLSGTPSLIVSQKQGSRRRCRPFRWICLPK
jgi:hypothetical protein